MKRWRSSIEWRLVVSGIPMIALIFLWSIGNPALACGGTPPQMVCGKSVVMAKAAPGPLLLTGGGVFNLPVTVFISATPACPAIANVQITINLSCTPGPGGSGQLITAGANLGFNQFQVPVTVLAGPPRICQVTGTTIVTFTDGTTVTAVGDAVICIVDPSPTVPDRPRLDLEHLLDDTVFVQPGDQAKHTYRVTNNDNSEVFTGTIRVGSNNSSRLPTTGGPNIPGHGVFAISDPGAQADNFPIFFGDQLPPPLCAPLPLNPQLFPPPLLERDIVLDPGETLDFEIITRPWGMCADGSCGESTVVLDGTFADLSPGLACTSSVTAVDTSAQPQFLWPGSGSAAFVNIPNPPQPLLEIIAVPSDVEEFVLNFQSNTQDVFVNEQPLPAGFFDFSDPLDQNSGRFQTQINGPFQAGDQLVIIQDRQMSSNEVAIEIVELSLVSVEPIGFEGLAPLQLWQLEIDNNPPDFVVDSFFDISFQISVEGVVGTNVTGLFPIESLQTFITPDPIAPVMTLMLEVQIPQNIDSLTVRTDLRGFARTSQAPFPCPPGPAPPDFNGDNLVNGLDLAVLVESFNQEAGPPQDRDGDGRITVLDIIDVLEFIGCQAVQPPPPLP